MKETDLRKWHRRFAIMLVLFIILQAGSGLLLSVIGLITPHSHARTESVDSYGHNEDGGESLWKGSLEFIHHGAGAIGAVYRIVLGIGILGMAVSGSVIFLKIRERS